MSPVGVRVMQYIKSLIDHHPVFEIIRIKNHEFMFVLL